MTVQNFMKIVWTVFEKFEIFMKSLGEKKQHDCISSRKFFPTPKKLLVIFPLFYFLHSRRPNFSIKSCLEGTTASCFSESCRRGYGVRPVLARIQVRFALE